MFIVIRSGNAWNYFAWINLNKAIYIPVWYKHWYHRIAGRHAEVRKEGSGFTLEPLEQNSRLTLNGKAVVAKTPLKHNDRYKHCCTCYFFLVLLMWHFYQGIIHTSSPFLWLSQLQSRATFCHHCSHHNLHYILLTVKSKPDQRNISTFSSQRYLRNVPFISLLHYLLSHWLYASVLQNCVWDHTVLCFLQSQGEGCIQNTIPWSHIWNGTAGNC